MGHALPAVLHGMCPSPTSHSPPCLVNKCLHVLQKAFRLIAILLSIIVLGIAPHTHRSLLDGPAAGADVLLLLYSAKKQGSPLQSSRASECQPATSVHDTPTSLS